MLNLQKKQKMVRKLEKHSTFNSKGENWASDASRVPTLHGDKWRQEGFLHTWTSHSRGNQPMLQVSRHPDSTHPKPSPGAECLIYPSLQHPEDEGETEGRSCLLSQGSEGRIRDSSP